MKKMVRVRGFVRSFVSGRPISEASISILENNKVKTTTDDAGQFTLEWPVGEELTLVFSKDPDSFFYGYKTTQTATLIVPEEGFNDPNYLKNISFQVPSNVAYAFFAFAMKKDKGEDPECCQITATITPKDTTMDNIPQGLEGVTVTLSPPVETPPFYFDILPLVHKTNPFTHTLTSTSLDGGIAFTNVPPGNYVLKAHKEGVSFTEVSIKARKGVLVNVSPPRGPTQRELLFFKLEEKAPENTTSMNVLQNQM